MFCWSPVITVFLPIPPGHRLLHPTSAAVKSLRGLHLVFVSHTHTSFTEILFKLNDCGIARQDVRTSNHRLSRITNVKVATVGNVMSSVIWLGIAMSHQQAVLNNLATLGFLDW
jgi:hypothetical protein